MKNKRSYTFLSFILLTGLIYFTGNPLFAQTNISEEVKPVKTYSFDDPNPIPVLTNNPKIYPYYRFEGYSLESSDQPWKIVTLENDYIKVLVLPEAGGKVWGAYEKSTGQEFIYHNKVIKFRNIAMRGPWTSGGIEFNFGIIGHSPSTASKVDYLTRKNADGSVSCFVGNLDLPSRTYWEVEIRLPEGNAYFETNVTWYNPTPVNQSYYNWMTGAAVASDDFEFIAPGNLYLAHSGEAFPWPLDREGRDLSMYKNNNFGPSKSYHVTGIYDDFFGGYYHNRHFGFGHWATYDDMPGHKLWLWALSRSGAIWKDLLTDDDGQYIEFQAGRLFNQYSPASDINPIGQAGFPPYVSDRWTDVWFPYKNTGGIAAVSPYGVMNLRQAGNGTEIVINALSPLRDTLSVTAGGREIFRSPIHLATMENFSKEIPGVYGNELQVDVGDHLLFYTGLRDSLELKRPFETDPDVFVSKIQDAYNSGLDAMYFREYEKAEKFFMTVLDKDPSHQDALLSMAELLYRKGRYQEALTRVNRVLMQDTYQPHANYLAGIIYRKSGDQVNALESLGWAARSMEFRSAAYAMMAEIYMKLKIYARAEKYASRALDYNRYNQNAHLVLAMAYRKQLKPDHATGELQEILQSNPLNHLARFERYLITDRVADEQSFTGPITNEFPAETYLEMALYYHSVGLYEEAIKVLKLGPESVKNDLWMAFILKGSDPEASDRYLRKSLEAGPEYVFPYRPETIEALRWMKEKSDSWKAGYYLALNLAGTGNATEAADLLTSLRDIPDFWVFYETRAALITDNTENSRLDDIRKAWQLAPENWRTWERLIRHYESVKDYTGAHELAMKARGKFPDNYTLGFIAAKTALETGDYETCIRILDHIQILPFEGSYESREVYEKAHLAKAVHLIGQKSYRNAIPVLNRAMEWPENIGVGKPYDPDQRSEEFLLAYCNLQNGSRKRSSELLEKVIAYTKNISHRPEPEDLLALEALNYLGRNKEANELLSGIGNAEKTDIEIQRWIREEFMKEDAGPAEAGSSVAGFDRLELISHIAGLFRK